MRPDQEVHRIDLYHTRSIYAPRITTSERGDERTFAGMIPGFVPIDNGGRERRNAGEGC